MSTATPHRDDLEHDCDEGMGTIASHVQRTRRVSRFVSNSSRLDSSDDRRSAVLRFFDTFLQEQNIKWMLGVGILILLGSSLMLVTSHWESYTPVWKYLILLSYTAIIHVAGQVSYHRFMLRKTGTGLMALTVLLIPLTFLAVRWVHPDALLSLAGLLMHTGLATMLVVNSLFSILAARRIFRHFLRQTQPTFLASFVILSFSGAIVPTLSADLAPWAALVLWIVFAAGVVKVNRHVFWLTEQHRQPRICGFFPILLLGG